MHEYENAASAKKIAENGLLMRPDTPESMSGDDVIIPKNDITLPKEVKLLLDDQKKPLHMICDVHGSEPKSKISLAERARLIQVF